MERSLWPKTIGAWALLFGPLITALALARPNIVGGLVAISAVSLFLAREPAVLALGYRGEEIRREEGWRARTWVRVCMALGIVLLAVAFVISDPRAKLAFGGPMVLWLLLGIITIRHEEKTYSGELINAAGLSAVGFPIAISEGVQPRIAIDVWTAWVLGFFAAVIAMRSIAEKGDRRQTRAYVWLGVLTGAGLVLWLVVPITAGFVPSVPLVATAWGIALLRPKKKKQKQNAGIALTAAAAVTGAILVYLTRAPG